MDKDEIRSVLNAELATAGTGLRPDQIDAIVERLARPSGTDPSHARIRRVVIWLTAGILIVLALLQWVWDGFSRGFAANWAAIAGGCAIIALLGRWVVSEIEADGESSAVLDYLRSAVPFVALLVGVCTVAASVHKERASSWVFLGTFAAGVAIIFALFVLHRKKRTA